MNLQSLTLLPSCSTVRMVLSTQGVWFAPHMTCCTGVQFESHQSSSIGSLVVTVFSLLLGNSSWNMYQIYELRLCVCVCVCAAGVSHSFSISVTEDCRSCWGLLLWILLTGVSVLDKLFFFYFSAFPVWNLSALNCNPCVFAVYLKSLNSI